MGRFTEVLPICKDNCLVICKDNWCFCLLFPLLFIAISLPQTPILPWSFSTSICTATKAVFQGPLFSLYPFNISLASSSLLYHSLNSLILLSMSFLVYIQMFIIKKQFSSIQKMPQCSLSLKLHFSFSSHIGRPQYKIPKTFCVFQTLEKMSHCHGHNTSLKE